MNLDFETFKKDINWLIRPNDIVTFTDRESLVNLSNNFTSAFPKLSQLIQRARVLDFNVNNDPYRLLSWTNKYNKSCGC